MQQTRLKIFVFLSLAGFFLGIMSITLHHHDNRFLQVGCSFCKVKISFSGTIHKGKTPNTPAALIFCISLAVVSLRPSKILPAPQTFFYKRRIAETYPNKAPPFILYQSLV